MSIRLYTLFKREVWQFFKYANDTLLEPVVSVLLFLAAFSMGIGSAVGKIGNLTYIEYIAPGLIMMTVLQNIFYNPSISIMVAKMEGRLHDLIMPPFSPYEQVMGLAGGGIVRGLVVVVVVSLALTPFVSVWPEHLGLALLYVLISGFLLSLIGILVGIVAGTFDQLMAYALYLITPLSYLSAAFFPNSALPESWQCVNEFNPFYYMIDGYRYALTGQAEADMVVGLMYLTGLCMFFYAIVHHIFAIGWRLKT